MVVFYSQKILIFEILSIEDLHPQAFLLVKKSTTTTSLSQERLVYPRSLFYAQTTSTLRFADALPINKVNLSFLMSMPPDEVLVEFI